MKLKLKTFDILPSAFLQELNKELRLKPHWIKFLSSWTNRDFPGVEISLGLAKNKKHMTSVIVFAQSSDEVNIWRTAEVLSAMLRIFGAVAQGEESASLVDRIFNASEPVSINGVSFEKRIREGISFSIAAYPD